MKSVMMTILTLIFWVPTVFALPALQLYIEGASYDIDTGTWIITDQTEFDLYVVGLPGSVEDSMTAGDILLDDVKLIVSTENEPYGWIEIDGEDYPEGNWIFGTPAFPPQTPPHGIFPAWYFLMDAGEFVDTGSVGNVIPDSNSHYFNPSEGYLDNGDHLGEIKSLGVEILGDINNLHFDVVAISDGRIVRFAPFSCDAGFIGQQTVVTENGVSLPTETALLNTYPNPFNAETMIQFTLNVASDVNLEIFDTQGRFVADLAHGVYNVGVHSVRWNGVNRSGAPVASGVYLVKLTTPETTITRNVVLLK